MSEAARDVRTDEAIAHLQQATLEFIAAARAVLDVAEEAVREPSGVMAVIAETIGGVAAAVGDIGPTLAARELAEDGPAIDALFQAVTEATEEAVINALFTADTLDGIDGHIRHGLPVEEVLSLLARRW